MTKPDIAIVEKLQIVQREKSSASSYHVCLLAKFTIHRFRIVEESVSKEWQHANDVY